MDGGWLIRLVSRQAPAALDRYAVRSRGCGIAHPSRPLGLQQLPQVSRHASDLGFLSRKMNQAATDAATAGKLSNGQAFKSGPQENDGATGWFAFVAALTGDADPRTSRRS